MCRGESTPARGYTLVAMLLLLALVSLGLAFAGPLWSQQTRREREQELLHIGTLYAQAIASYRDLSPGTDKQYPPNLEALLNDARFVVTRRHLRKAYPDPLNPRRPWGLLRNEAGRVTGVYSQDTEAPLARGAIALEHMVLPPAQHYSDWKFIAKVKS